MATSYYSLRQRRANANSHDRLAVKLDQERYELECGRVLEAFLGSPSPETLQASLEALERFQQMHARWIAPVLNRLNPTF
jgi:hypothetical protein